MLRLPFKIYSSKKYWELRDKTLRLKFIFDRQLYLLKNFFLEEKYNANSTVAHIKLTIWGVFRAVGFVVLLFGVEHCMMIFWHSNYKLFPDWFVNFQKFIPKPTYPRDRDAIIELVSVIASVTGVILALFYPILATIASTAYAKVHASIRNLLLNEKETQAYLRRLTFLTACSITVLFFLSLNFLPGNLVLTFLSFYSLTTLFGILKIGLGVYNFFEPSTLAGIVFTKLTENIKNVSTGGAHWNDRNFQSHNYKLAFEQTENLSLLMRLCFNDHDLRESSFKSIFQTSLLTLQFYSQQKSKIPITSLWFPDYYHHPSFFESDMSQRNLAINTNTFVQPTLKPDKHWLEERIVNNLAKGLEAIIESGHKNVYCRFILMTYPLLDSLGTNADFRTGEMLLSKLFSSLTVVSKTIEKKTDKTNYEAWQDELGCISNYCFAILRFQIGIFNVATIFTADKIQEEYKKINWENKSTIYSNHLIPDLKEKLNCIRHFIQNEKAVEGKQITPDWYFQQELAAEYLRVISEKIQAVINLFETHILSLANHFDNMNQPLLSTYTAQTGLEIIHKLDFRIGELEPIFADIDKLEVCKGEFKWVKPNFNDIERLLKDLALKCLKIVSKNIDEISSLEWNNKYPDVFAHSYSLLANHLNDCFKTKNTVEFQNHFPLFLSAAMKAFANLNKTYKHLDNSRNISYQTLLDAIEISGYGYIYAVVYNELGFWDCIKKAWDETFLPTKENIQLVVYNYLYYKKALFGTGINYHEQHLREITLSNVTANLRLRPQDLENFFVKPFIKESFHSSYYSVAELFLEIYLFTFIEAKDSTALLDRELFNRLCRDIENPREYYDY